MKNTLIIFGGADYESEAARKVAIEVGLNIATAITADGKKVHAGNAYMATGFVLDHGNLEEVTGVVIFECAPVVAGELPVILRADHHNPGDTGFGLGPEKFWEASSLGQLMNFIGLEPTEEQLIIAASDHCPAAAYKGLCPGIDPAAFAESRLQQKLVFFAGDPRNAHKATRETLLAVIETAKAKLLSAPEVDGVRDLREAGYVDELPEAALSLGLAYMTQIPDTDRDRNLTGNTKILLGGHTTPEAVTKFMEWGNSLPNKVGPAYGNPIRGFAGVVITPEISE
ncbi:MAG: hypothetical protein WCI93_02640 [bacterium]